MQWDSMERFDSREYILNYKRLLSPEPDAFVFVESERDVFFWKWIFQNYAKDFVVAVRCRYSAKSSGGKHDLLKLNEKNTLCEEILICVDSDYDYLLQSTVGKTMSCSPYIFQTYAYSVENYNCLAESLNLVCIQASSNDCPLFDFRRYMREYSNIVYKLFLFSIYFEQVRSKKFKIQREKDRTFTRTEFHRFIRLNNLEIKNNGGAALQKLRKNAIKKEQELKQLCHDNELEKIKHELEHRDVNKNNVYLFIRGKNLLDGVITKLLRVVVSQLIKNKIREYEQSVSNQQILEDKLLEYSHTVCSKALKSKKVFEKESENTTYLEYLKSELNSASPNLEFVLKNNLNMEHDNCPLMQKIKKDIEKYIEAFHFGMSEQLPSEGD